MARHPRRLGVGIAIIAVAGLLAAMPALAQEAAVPADAAAAAAGEATAAAGGLGGLLGGFDLGLGVGATAFTDVTVDELGNPLLVSTTYQKLSLTPDLAFGKFGLGLDITFHVNFSGGPTGKQYLRKEDWVPVFADDAKPGEKFAAVAELYLGKFRYVRWGLRGDPLYIKFGMIDDGTLGNGFLMGNYANTLFLPETRILGVALGLDGSLFKFPLLGMETFVGNLARFDVFGARLYVRPLTFTTVPILKNLMIGGTIAVDRNPYLYGDGNPDLELTPALPVVALGVDVQQPILTNPMLSLAALVDWGLVSTTNPDTEAAATGNGAAFGIGGRLVKFLTYGAQIRIVGSRFVPVYFDSMYDLDRANKYGLLIAPDDEVAPAFAGWLASIGTSLLENSIIFQLGVSGPFGKPVKDPVTGEPVADNELNWPQVRGVARIEGDFLRGFSFLASYDKKNIDGGFRDLISPLDAVIQARVNYETGPAVISFVYNLKYLPEPVADAQGDLRRWEVTSGLETSIKLF